MFIMLIKRNQQLQSINSCRAIGFADAHADWAAACEGTELKPGKRFRASQTSCTDIIALLFWRQLSCQASLSCLFPLSLSALASTYVPWTSDVTTPTHCADRRTLACCRRFVITPRTPPAYGLVYRRASE